MPRHLPFFFILILIAFASPALAQTANNTGFNISWAALDPGTDWVAQVITSVFPINGNTCQGGGGAQPSTCTGTAATVIGTIVGQLTGFVLAIAMAFVCYLTIINIHRVAESSQILTNAMTSLFVVRLGFGAIMMFPLSSGFSTGQAAVVQASMWGIGMAKTVYANAVTAMGPDALVIATPMIPGTKNTVLNLIQDELCRALINQATNTVSSNPQMVPAPAPTTVTNQYGGATTWAYTLSSGNQTRSPACGTVTVKQPSNTPQTVNGVNTDMTGQQQTILQNVLSNDIRPSVESVAANYWQTKQTSALTPLQATYVQATADYTQQLTTAATSITSQLNAAITAQDARNGSVGLIQNENQLSALGWSGAGAYYLLFAQINGRTLSLLNATPIINMPSFDGLSTSLKNDLAPLISGTTSFLTTLRTYATTTDGNDVPGANADLFTGQTNGDDGSSMLEHVFRSLNITEPLLHFFTDQMSPTGNQWTDPFSALIILGQKLINASLVAFGLALAATSPTATAATTFLDILTGNWGAAAATNILHQIVQFFATPIFLGILSLLIPGLTIAYILPMIPWVMWIAGVAGYLILVCEAVIAVPLWMLAHMTFEGAGLHGRGTQGYELIFNVLFRPVLMLLGLFLGYFVFTSMSWLIRMTFGVAAHFVLENGWLVTNFFGLIVLLSIYVMAHVTAALMSFQMISLVPHHLPKLIGFSSANRVDMDEFSKAAAWVGTRGALSEVDNSTRASLSRQSPNNLVGSPSRPSVSAPPKALTGPAKRASGNSATGSVDSTLNASTDMSPPPSS